MIIVAAVDLTCTNIETIFYKNNFLNKKATIESDIVLHIIDLFNV